MSGIALFLIGEVLLSILLWVCCAMASRADQRIPDNISLSNGLGALHGEPNT